MLSRIKNKIRSSRVYHYLIREYKVVHEDLIDVSRYPKLYYASFGPNNPDLRFYVIYGHKAGLFSNLQFVIACIRQAELMGMIPVVDYRNFPNLYTMQDPVCESNNSWEYYFERVSKYSLDEVYSSKNVFFCSGEYNWGMGFYLSPHSFYDYYSRYIRLKPYIQNEIDEQYARLFKGAGSLACIFVAMNRIEQSGTHFARQKNKCLFV